MWFSRNLRIVGLRAASAATAAAAGVATTALALQTSATSCESGGASKLMGRTAEGRPVFLRTLSNGPLRVQVMDFGATITSVVAPAADGSVGEVTLGFNELAPYTDGRSPYFGCVAGRFANRIAKGVFSLEGREYKLATNNGPNALHGGNVGFDKQVWVCEAQSDTSLTLALHSPDGQEGYPGALVARVTYSLPSPTSLCMEYSATSDAPTPLNLTNHTYWNLADGGKTSVLAHEVELAADFYTPVDDTSIPTGEVRAVAGAMDLRARAPFGKGIAAADNGMGYDHNYVLRKPDGADGMRPVARVWEPSSGRWMAVRTDQPGVQLYTGNYLDGSPGRGGVSYGKHHGFCLETQRFPDTPNRPHFPSCVLHPGQVYTHTTVHEFGTASKPPTGAY